MYSISVRSNRLGLAALVALCGMIAGEAVAQTGSARAAYVNTAATGASSTAEAVLPAGGGYQTAGVDAVSIGGVLGAGMGTAVTTGLASMERTGVQSVASLANVDILAGMVRAETVIAIASSMRNGSEEGAESVGSTIAGLVVNGVPVNTDNLAPNTRIDIPGGYVLLNEVIQGAGSITVNMIHVVLTAPLTGLKIGEVIVGSATSANE